MTITECISYVDGIEPNAYTAEQKQRWIRECEGKVYRQVFGMQPWTGQTLEQWAYSVDSLVVPEPWDKLYPRYLQAMIHYANGEYDRYAASMQMFNEAWGELNRWFGSDYDVTDRNRNRRVTFRLNMSVGRQILMTLPPRYAYIGRIVVREPAASAIFQSVQTRDVEIVQYSGRVWVDQTNNYIQSNVNMYARGTYPLPMVIGEPGGTVLGIDHITNDAAEVYVTGILCIPEEDYEWRNELKLAPQDVEVEEER